MDESKDISSRIRNRFFDEIAENGEHRQLAEPLKALLSASGTIKPDQVAALYRDAASSELDQNHKQQDAP